MLLETKETVTYLDPDTILYNRFPDDANATWEFQVTPHIIAPSNISSLISERLFMLHGVFNLGYFAVRKSTQTLAFLKWWKDFCVDYGMDAPQAGLFADQKPADLLPCFIDRLHVLRHPGCNVVWWNIFLWRAQYRVWEWCGFQQGVWPLIFYHFSNLDCEKNPTRRKMV